MSNERVCVGAPASSEPANFNIEGLGNATRIFLTRPKNRQYSSATRSHPEAVKTEPDPSAESLGGPKVPQLTQAIHQTSRSRLSSQLFISVEEDPLRGSLLPTGSSSQGVSARLATVSLVGNMDSKNQLPNTPTAKSRSLATGLALNTTSIQPRNANPQKSMEVGECITGAMVTVTIGSASEPKTLHKNVLCHQSEYFKNKYEQYEFASGTKEVTLDMVKASVFQHWTACAYGNSFTVTMDDIEKAYQLYYLASDLSSPNIQDTAIDAIRMAYRDARGWPSQQRVTTAYENTSIGSPLRRFLTECVYFNIVEGKADASIFFGGTDFPCEFVRDYVRMGQEATESAESLVDPRSKEGCEFHMHDTADLCNA